MFQNDTDDSYYETIVSNVLFKTVTTNLFKAFKFPFRTSYLATQHTILEQRQDARYSSKIHQQGKN